MIRVAGLAVAAALAVSPVVLAGQSPGEETATTMAVEEAETQPAADHEAGSYDVNRFVLPEDAGMLIVVEGTGDVDLPEQTEEAVGDSSRSVVRVYERTGDSWVKCMETVGHLGKNGLSNDRTEGDSTTPIGLFQMNTPFGQKAALDGFPANYVRVDGSYVWEERTNRLVQGSTAAGERVGSAGYAGYYDYVLDFGYNRQAIAKKGSALFLHCEGEADTFGTHGCVAIPTESMIAIMKRYGTWGDGHCYIALAPQGKFEAVYDSYGMNDGLSPEGDF